MAESLDRNPFYLALMEKYSKWFRIASENRYLVCIPQTTSCRNLKITEKLIKSHILKPSPLLRQNYLPLDDTSIETVIRSEGKLIAVGRKGSPVVETVILEVEEAYNSKFQKYDMLIVNHAITEQSSENRLTLKQENETQQALTSYQQCLTYLKDLSLTSTDKMLEKLHEFSETFSTQIDSLDDTYNELKSVIRKMRSLYERTSVIDFDLLSLAVESVVMATVYEKVFGVVKEQYAEDQATFQSRLEQIKKSCRSLDALGSSDFNNFQVNVDISASILKISLAVTPLEKVEVLRTTLNEISGELCRSTISALSPFESKETSQILPDDLVAATVFTLATVSVPSFLCHIRYLKHFGASLPAKNEYGYSLVTFEVATEFIKNMKPADSEKSVSPLSKASSVERQRSYSFQQYRQQKSLFEDELEKITKLIENKMGVEESSTGQQAEQTSGGEADSPDQLGEFLGALQENHFCVNYGKQ
ncbi:Ankyrin repeat domain-containing protein 27 [Halotydeus destructor]|nr:Ankyrin repeat domain-containing protein 27 [Halotydeus destructor]